MHRTLSVLLLCGALFGQNATIIMRAPEKELESLAQLARQLKREQGAAWLLLEGVQGNWIPGFSEVLSTDDDLMTIGISAQTLSVKSPLATELRAQHGWGPEARWVLLGLDAKVLESGRTLPAARQLADLLESHGVRGEIRELESFLAMHPGHIQAAEKLLGRYISLAERRTARLLKPAQEKTTDDERPLELLRPLTDSEDARFWGKPAAMMERMVLSGDWRLGPMFGWASRRYETGQFSPLMGNASRRCLPAVEESLRQHPGQFQVWILWSQLAANTGGRPLRPLLDSVVPAPGENSAIPEQAFAAYIRDARNRGDWSGIIDVLGQRWERQKEDAVKVISIGESGKVRDALKSTWDSVLKPLVEAHLRLGNSTEADRIVREAMIWMPSKGLPAWASALALRCGQTALSAQWASLSVPTGR